METASREPADRSNAPWAFLVRWLPPTACVAAIALAAYPAYLPTVDGPQQLYYLHILRNYREMSAWYDWSVTVGALGYPILLLPLGLVLPWALAYKLSLSAVLLLWCSSVWAFARAMNHRRELVVAVVGAALSFQWSFYMGFLSYLVGTSLGLWAIATVVAPKNKTRLILIPSLLAASVIAHAFAGVLSIVVVAAIRLIETGRAIPRLKAAARDCLPAVIILAVFTTRHSVEGAAALSEFLPFEDRLWGLTKMMAGGPWWRCLPPFFLALAGIGAVLSAWSRGKGTRVERLLAVAALALFVVALLAPLHTQGWMHLSPRFLPLATVFGLVLIPVERISRKWLAGGVCLWACAAMTWTTVWHLRMQTALEPVLDAAAAPLHRQGMRLPIVGRDPWGPSTISIQNDYPYFDPLFNASLLISLGQGGMQPYTFTVQQGIHLFVRRPPAPDAPPVPNRDHYWLGLLDPEVSSKPGLRESLLIDLASAASRFEDVILFGEYQDISVLEGLGFQTDLRRDWVWIGHFRGCAARLNIEAPEGEPKDAKLSFGWFPMMKPFWSGHSDRPPQGDWVVELPGTPCGPIWVEALTDDGRTCSGSTKDGKLGFLNRTDQQALRCVIRSR